MKYSIVEEPSFIEAAGKLGGSIRVDMAIEVLIEPLSNKPHEFESIEIGTHRFRYAVTKRITNAIPPLVIIFTIDDTGSAVRLQHVEAADFPYGEI